VESQQSPFDKRTLLAFALMFLVWFGWMAIFPSPKPEPPVADEGENPAAQVVATDPSEMPVMPTSPERLSAVSPDGGSSGAAFTGWTQRSEGERGETILVRTPNFEA